MGKLIAPAPALITGGNRFTFYQSNGFLEIPTMGDIPHVCEREGNQYHNCSVCRTIKKPAIRWKNFGGWSEEEWFRFHARHIRKFGRAPGRASLTGPRTGIDGYHIMTLDHDHDRREYPGSKNIEFFRARKTWINFSPNWGWHDVFLVPRRYSAGELEKVGILCGGPLRPAHDILYWIPPDLRKGKRTQGGPSYFLHENSKIHGSGYFWLDESKMLRGQLEIRRLDL
jgi:hypothetical protein